MSAETSAPNVSPPPPGLSPERLAEIEEYAEKVRTVRAARIEMADGELRMARSFVLDLLSHISTLTREHGAGGVTEEMVERAARAIGKEMFPGRLFGRLTETFRNECLTYARAALSTARGGA